MHVPDSQDLTARLQDALQQLLYMCAPSTQENILCQVTAYALTTGGKLLRGRMLLEACHMVGGEIEDALFAAVAVEYLHLGTLIHDDIIDRDEVRRGKPAVWKHYNSDLALLSGDFLYFAAFQSLARSLSSANAALAAHILDRFSRACMDLCLGQALEEKLVGNCRARYEDYLEVVRGKTASLFRTALEVGALLGGETLTRAETLGECAEHLGIAFQIIDDLLPFTSDHMITGKPLTSDIKNRRLTAPILSALAGADEADRQTLCAIFEEGRFDEHLAEAYALVREILQRTHALEKTEQEATDRYQQAMQVLQTFPDNAGRNQLIALAQQLVRRHK